MEQLLVTIRYKHQRYGRLVEDCVDKRHHFVHSSLNFGRRCHSLDCEVQRRGPHEVSLPFEYELQVGLAKRLSELLLEVGLVCDLFLLDAVVGVGVPREESEGQAGRGTLHLPYHLAVAFRDLLAVLGWRLELSRNLHVKNDLKHLDPRCQPVVLLEEGTEDELVGDVENFNDLV